jgi:hypothetical protein
VGPQNHSWRAYSESKPLGGEPSQQSEERLSGRWFRFFAIQGAVLVSICRIALQDGRKRLSLTATVST